MLPVFLGSIYASFVRLMSSVARHNLNVLPTPDPFLSHFSYHTLQDVAGGEAHHLGGGAFRALAEWRDQDDFKSNITG